MKTPARFKGLLPTNQIKTVKRRRVSPYALTTALSGQGLIRNSCEERMHTVKMGSHLSVRKTMVEE